MAHLPLESQPEDKKECLCIIGCVANGECPIHGDGGHLPSIEDFPSILETVFKAKK